MVPSVEPAHRLLSAADQRRLDDVHADFWRCYDCGRLCTGLEMKIALAPGGNGAVCPCGSQRYRPANLPWYGWLLPRVWIFAVMRLRGQA